VTSGGVAGLRPFFRFWFPATRMGAKHRLPAAAYRAFLHTRLALRGMAPFALTGASLLLLASALYKALPTGQLRGLLFMLGEPAGGRTALPYHATFRCALPSSLAYLRGQAGGGVAVLLLGILPAAWRQRDCLRSLRICIHAMRNMAAMPAYRHFSSHLKQERRRELLVKVDFSLAKTGVLLVENNSRTRDVTTAAAALRASVRRRIKLPWALTASRAVHRHACATGHPVGGRRRNGTITRMRWLKAYCIYAENLCAAALRTLRARSAAGCAGVRGQAAAGELPFGISLPEHSATLFSFCCRVTCAGRLLPGRFVAGRQADGRRGLAATYCMADAAYACGCMRLQHPLPSLLHHMSLYPACCHHFWPVSFRPRAFLAAFVAAWLIPLQPLCRLPTIPLLHISALLYEGKGKTRSSSASLLRSAL